MESLTGLLQQHGPLLVFLNVLVEQLGAPVPAVPVLVVAGALSVEGGFTASAVVAVAVLASGIANVTWYLIGRRYGRRVLGLVCRITMSPDVCVRETENVFSRWGVATVMIARFIPGVSSVAAPLAGAMRMSPLRFVLFDTLGTSAWAILFVGTGVIFHREVEAVLSALSDLGVGALWVLVGLLVLYLALRWAERQRLLRFVRTHRVHRHEIEHLLGDASGPILVDLRSTAARSEDPRRVPGAREIELRDLRRALQEVPLDQEIVVLCACPNEASAAKATRLLLRHGYKRVRPLAGGIDGWFASPRQADAKQS
ncbi:MAG: VTT domain-containing protein [Burkholderiales bacterium]|jgi:membrane protein DedA with SNARE-associated domain/rhodanese-related sulfurtransferase|nr:VTT domain-containing protein [Burkholderiales bacterium]